MTNFTLNCQAIEPLLPAFALEVLDEGEYAQVAAHLERCAHCRQRYGEYRAIAQDLLDAVPQRLAPPAIQQALMARVQPARRGRLARWAQRWRMTRSKPAF